MKLQLTLTCGDYEIVRPLKEGRVQPDGVELNMLTNSRARQIDIYHNAACDAGEVTMMSYFCGRDRGHPFTALPVFPHRRFRHGFIFVNPAKGYKKPADLKGGKFGCIGGPAAAANVWVRGIFSDHYGLSHKDVTWYTDLFDFEIKQDGFRIEYLPQGVSLEEMLLNGELDALMTPNTPRSFIARDKRIARLFPDFAAEEIAYYNKTKIFPIMHALVVKDEIIAKYPWVPGSLAAAFEESKRVALQHLRNPRILPLTFYTSVMEEQDRLFGPDPWQYGLNDINRNNLQTALRYAYEQGLTATPRNVDEFFYPIDNMILRGFDSV